MTVVIVGGALVAGGCDIGAAATEELPATSATAASPLSEASAAAPAAASAPRSTAPGPCGGATIGSHRCDGELLLRCGLDSQEEIASCGELQRCDAEAEACVSTCPEGMVRIPPTGPEGFVMGRDYLGSVTAPDEDYGKGFSANTDHAHPVVLTHAFCLDQNEITVKEWDACMEADRCPRPNEAHRFVTWPDEGDHPVNCVDWRGARGYCGWKGKTLPTEAQWEWAATRGDRRDYPWGNERATCEHADYVPGVLLHPAGDAGCHGGGPSPVGSHPAGDIEWPDGPLHDMAGNVWEWCQDNYRPYDVVRAVDPLVWRGESAPHVVRGGGWNRSHAGIRAAFRGAAIVGYTVPGLGFRCALNPPGVALPGDP